MRRFVDAHRTRSPAGKAPWNWLTAFCLVGGSCLSAASSSSAADRIVLRNLEVISDRTVTAFDEDGVVLDNQRVLTWDEVEQAKLATRQAEFNKLLEELGEPLYRVRQRLSVGDYQGLLSPAEALFPRYAARRSRSAYLVLQALMWGRLDAGRREAALEPYLLAIDCLRRFDAAMQQDLLPGERRLRWDPATGLSDELPPVWFDGDAAREALPRVGRAIGAMKRPWPEGIRIYYASLALAADDQQRAAGALQQLDRTTAEIQQLALLLELQQEVLAGRAGAASERIRSEWQDYTGLRRVIALYWLGRADDRAESLEQRQDALLQLLRVPAAYGTQFPELAAAALYHAQQILEDTGDTAAATAVRGELFGRYSGTYYAAKLRSQPAPEPSATKP